MKFNAPLDGTQVSGKHIKNYLALRTTSSASSDYDEEEDENETSEKSQPNYYVASAVFTDSDSENTPEDDDEQDDDKIDNNSNVEDDNDDEEDDNDEEDEEELHEIDTNDTRFDYTKTSESEEDASDDSDSDSDTDSDSGSDSEISSGFFINRTLQQSTSKPLHKKQVKKQKNLKPPPKIQIPKRLDLSSFRNSASPAPSGGSTTLSSNESVTKLVFQDDDDDDSGLSDLSVMSETELNALEASIPEFRRRRDSVVDQSLDDNLTFPRSTIADTISEENSLSSIATSNEFEDNDEDEGDDEDDDEDDYEFDDDDDKLLVMMDSDYASSTADPDTDSIFGDDDEADNDSAIEEEEERALVEEVEKSGDLNRPPSPLMTGYYSDDDEFDSDWSFQNAAFFDGTPETETVTNKSGSNANGHTTSNNRKQSTTNDLSDDDDSYLWSYFFTSDEGSSSSEDDEDSRQGMQNAAGQDEDFSGESTDEDESVPHNANCTPASKPTEILSSSNTVTRPPVLGSWVTNTERPYGIIDGLTTRTLSPPDNGKTDKNKTPTSAVVNKNFTFKRDRGSNDWENSVADSPLAKRQRKDSLKNSSNELDFSSLVSPSSTNGTQANGNLNNSLSSSSSLTSNKTLKNGSSSVSTKASKTDSQVIDDSSDSSPDEIVLDDFIYTSELDEDGEEDEGYVGSVYDSFTNRDIPLSAFRNRSMSFANPQLSMIQNGNSATGSPSPYKVNSQGTLKRRKSSSASSRRTSVSSWRNSQTMNNNNNKLHKRNSISSNNNNGSNNGNISFDTIYAGIVLPTPTVDNSSNQNGNSTDKGGRVKSARPTQKHQSNNNNQYRSEVTMSSMHNNNSKKLKKRRRRLNRSKKLLLEGISESGHGDDHDLFNTDLEIGVDIIGNTDLIEELVGIGALSPLFGEIS